MVNAAVLVVSVDPVEQPNALPVCIISQEALKTEDQLPVLIFSEASTQVREKQLPVYKPQLLQCVRLN